MAQRNPGASTAASREIEDLKTKLRLMEKKRMEDRDKLKVMEQIKTERDKFESIIQKMQSKYQPQQEELKKLRQDLKDAEALFNSVETMQSDHDLMIENATLDREMAEEMAELFKVQVQDQALKIEELELEVEVL